MIIYDLELKIWKKFKVVQYGTCTSAEYKKCKPLPIETGKNGKKTIKVLRDTGCNCTIVR